jgi:hypothetical protein
MKEVNMKKLLFWMVLIVGIVALIGSCKKDEETAATSSGGCTVVNSCSATVSADNITGIAGGWMSGTYDKMIIHANSGFAVDNTTGCVSEASLVSGPTGTQSIKYQTVVTGSNSYANTTAMYSDTSCSVPILTYTWGKSDAALGVDLSGLSVSGYPSTATKFTYKNSCYEIYPYNEAGATYINTAFAAAGITTVAGTKLLCQDNGNTEHGLLHISDSTWDGTASDNRTLLMEDEGSTAFSTWVSPSTMTRID